MRQPPHDRHGPLGVRHQVYAYRHHRKRHRIPEVLVCAAALQGLVPIRVPADHQQPVRHKQHDPGNDPLDEQRGQDQHADPDQRLRPGLPGQVGVELGD
ncbi:hypothetical protein D3C78_1612990 [compost metagenome]